MCNKLKKKFYFDAIFAGADSACSSGSNAQLKGNKKNMI